MSSEPQATPPGERAPRQFTEPLRELVALVLVGATAVFLLVALIRLVPYEVDSFTERAQTGFYNFVNLATIAFPILAVLLVTHIGTPTGRAKLITMVALAEYAAAALFGVLFGFFVGLIRAAELSFRFAFEEFLTKIAWLAVLGVVAYVVYQLWRGLYQPAKPKPVYEPYGGTQYGQPQQPAPGWGGQPAPQGQPQGQQWGQPGQGAPGAPGQWGQQPPQGPPPGQPGPQPGWGEPTQVAQPGQWGQPPQSAPPQSAPPYSGSSQFAPPQSGAPYSTPPQSAPPAPNGPYPPQGPYQPPQSQYGYGQPPAGPAFNEPTDMYGRHTYNPDDLPGEDPNRR